jgi:hypothetical protein
MRPSNTSTIVYRYRGKRAQHGPKNREICREDVEHALGQEIAARLEHTLHGDQAGVDILFAKLAIWA